MNRFERVIQILDNAIGGPDASIGAHGAFWRGLTRDQFVAKSVFTLQVITVGQGAPSNLVKALKGETPGRRFDTARRSANGASIPSISLTEVPPKETACEPSYVL